MRYDVNITRDGRWWMIEIPALDGLTQARRITDAQDMAREYIAVTLDVPLSTVELGGVSVIAGGTDYAAVGDAVRDWRRKAEALEHDAADLMIKAAREMTAAQVPQRDIGALLGVTHQRVAQLVGKD